MSFANRQASHVDLEGLIVAEPPSAQATLDAEPSPIGGGVVRNHLSTALVMFYRDVFGRGPVRTTTYEFEAGYVTFLREVLVPHERALVRGGRADLVCDTRMAIRRAQGERLIAEVQRLTGRPVLHDSFQFQPERNLAIELFWVPTGSAHGAGNAPAPQAIAPTDLPYTGRISDGER